MNKKLLVDVGHTRTKWCWFDGCDLYNLASCKTDFNVLYEKLTSEVSGVKVTSLTVSCVVDGDARETFMKICERTNVKRLIWLSHSTQNLFAVTTKYSDPAALGIDRLIVCSAAHEITKNKVIVIDAGSATTIDYVSADGVHEGGVIMPGMQASIGCLSKMIPKLDPNGMTANIAGLNPLQIETRSGLLHGGIYAWCGGVNMAVSEIIDGLSEGECELFVTGGDAAMLSPHLRYKHRIDDYLIFKGMMRF